MKTRSLFARKDDLVISIAATIIIAGLLCKGVYSFWEDTSESLLLIGKTKKIEQIS
jgi:hypothetical protein